MYWVRKSVILMASLVLAGWPLAAQTHVMSRAADPWAVPVWEEIFNEGPFDLPVGGTVGTTVEKALELGWAALHALDEREAERAFRLAITRDENRAAGYFGLALANDRRPGRASVCAARAVEKLDGTTGGERRLINALAALCQVRGPGRRAAEMNWVRELRAVWAAAPPGVEKNDLAALYVRGLARAGLAPEARLRLRELRAAAPDHPARAYDLWLAIRPAEALDALAVIPPTAGAHRAAGEMLESLGRPEDAVRWFAAASALAASRHPADMEDWRFVEEMRTAAVSARTAAGLADFPDDVPVSDRIDGWLRLEAWDRLAAVPRYPETSSLTDRMTVGHARALAAVMSGRADDAEAELAELVALMAEARAPGAGGMTAAEVAAAAELVTEVQLHQLAARGETEAARGQFASLRHLPPGRLARLALRLDLPLEAIRNARMASQMRPNAQPEKRLLLAITTATEQRLPPEDGVAALTWPPVPAPAAPAAPPPAADAGQMPSWSVLDAAGTPRTLEEIQDGRPAVILFFLGHECRHCMDQLRTFEPMAARFEQAGARLIAISADGPDGVNQTWASLETDPVRRQFSFPVFAGAGLEAFRQWGVMDAFYGQAIHGVFVLDAGRRLRWRHLGVEPFTDVSDVLAAVYGLAAGQ